MLPTLQIGDRIVVDKLSYRLPARPARRHRGLPPAPARTGRLPRSGQAGHRAAGRHHRAGRTARCHIDGRLLDEPWLPQPAAADARRARCPTPSVSPIPTPSRPVSTSSWGTTGPTPRTAGTSARSRGASSSARWPSSSGRSTRRAWLVVLVGGRRAGGLLVVVVRGSAPARGGTVPARGPAGAGHLVPGRGRTGRPDRRSARAAGTLGGVPFLSPAKLLVILVVALVVLGPDKLPKVARQIGGLWGDFRTLPRAARVRGAGHLPRPALHREDHPGRAVAALVPRHAGRRPRRRERRDVRRRSTAPTPERDGDAVQPSAGANRPAGTVQASEEPPARPRGRDQRSRRRRPPGPGRPAAVVPDDPGMN